MAITYNEQTYSCWPVVCKTNFKLAFYCKIKVCLFYWKMLHNVISIV